jgi:cell division protein ZapA (FtsZ GTPase activity inhibitor)
MDTEKQRVRVTILSRPYTVRASGDPREVEEVAESVNALMLSIAEKMPSANSADIAVLACLQLADKLRVAEREMQELRQRKDGNSAEYAAMLERLITSVEELSA